MHGVNIENKSYIIGIDIGSSNVVMTFGERNAEGVVSVLGVSSQPIEDCVKDGDIVNFIELGNAISKAKKELEKEVGRTINSAYVGISGRSVYCVRYEDYVNINDRSSCVTESALRELHARIEMVVSGGGDEIIERIPLRYIIDDHQEVKNPIGAFGKKLSATYLFVLAGKHQIDRINRAMHCAEISVSGLCVNPTITPNAILREDEREEGVAIVDIGSDLTDISIVKGGKLWYFSSLPIGASAITNDLYDFLRIPKRDIETVKRKYGWAIADAIESNVTVSVKTATKANKQILQRNIAEIAEERLKDISRFVARELKAAKFSTKLSCGVVLTGGSAYLADIDKLFARELNMEVRFATMFNGIDDESQLNVAPKAHSVAVGLLLYGAKHNACKTTPPIGVVNEERDQLPEQPITPPTQPTPPVVPTPPTPPVSEEKKEEAINEVTPKEMINENPEPPVEGVHNNPEKQKLEDDNNDTPNKTEKQEEQTEQKEEIKKVEDKKKKGGLFSRLRGWLEDNLYNDELI